MDAEIVPFKDKEQDNWITDVKYLPRNKVFRRCCLQGSELHYQLIAPAKLFLPINLELPGKHFSCMQYWEGKSGRRTKEGFVDDIHNHMSVRQMGSSALT